MISRDKETLKAVKLNSKHVEDFVANAERNDIQAVYQALSEGVISVDSVDSAGYTALQCASKANNLKMCSLWHSHQESATALFGDREKARACQEIGVKKA